MAKNIPLSSKDNAPEAQAPKGAKIVELAKKEAIDNLKHKENIVKGEEVALEKEKAAIDADLDAQIAKKKAQLIELSKAEAEIAEIKTENKPAAAKKEKKWDINPLNWVRHIGTRALSGIGGFPYRLGAKIQHIVARPQQLWSKEFYKDIGKNIIKTPKAILTTLTGALYKPHRDTVKFEDSFKDYGPEFANPTDKSKVVRVGKKALWTAGKVAAPLGGGVFALAPKFFANIGRGMKHVVHEALEGIKDSKFHWNPMKWNLKSWKFTKTKEAFGKAFSWNKKGTSAGKTMEMPKEHKKAA